MNIDWAAFCRHESERLPNEPIVIAITNTTQRLKIATDTKILIAIPTEEEVTDLSVYERLPNWSSVLNLPEQVREWTAFPEDRRTECMICNGIRVMLCPNCGGDGEVMCNMKHLHACRQCGGAGTIACECQTSREAVGSAHISGKYFDLIQSLPSPVTYGRPHKKKNSPLCFRFGSDGIGVVVVLET